MQNTIKPSRSNPQYAGMLRKIMLVDAIIKARNDDYDRQLEEFLAKSPKLNAKERDAVIGQFTRGFYREETDALATYEAIKKRHQNRIDPTFNSGDTETLEKERYILAMGPEAYVAQSLFTDSAFISLSAKYPGAAEKLKRDIRAESTLFKNDFPASAAHWPATVSLFNKRYPGAQYELEKLQENPGGPDSLNAERKGLMSAALTMLKVGSAVANPSGFLISKAIGGLMQTDAMKPMVNGVALAVKRVGERSGLTSAVKAQFSKLSTTQKTVVAGALATVGVTTMVMLGLVDADKAIDYAHNMIDAIKESSINIAEQGYEVAASAYDYASSELGIGAPEKFTQVAGGGFQDGILSDPDSSLKEPVGTPVNDTQDGSAPGNLPPKTPASPENIASVLEQSGQPAPENISPSAPPENMIAPAENYRIKPGDTLSEIIEARLQQAGIPYDYNTIAFHVNAAAEFNGLDNPDLIVSGKTITLPEISGATKLASTKDIADAMKSAYDVADFKPHDFSQSLNAPLVGKADPFADPLTVAQVFGQSTVTPVDDASVQQYRSPRI